MSRWRHECWQQGEVAYWETNWRDRRFEANLERDHSQVRGTWERHRASYKAVPEGSHRHWW